MFSRFATYVWGLGAQADVDVVGAVVCNGKTIVCTKEGGTLVLYNDGDEQMERLGTIENVKRVPSTMMFTADNTRVCLFAMTAPDARWEVFEYDVVSREMANVRGSSLIGFSDTLDVMHMGYDSEMRLHALIGTDGGQLHMDCTSEGIEVTGPGLPPMEFPEGGVKLSCAGLVSGTSWVIDRSPVPGVYFKNAQNELTQVARYEGTHISCFGIAVVCDTLVVAVKWVGDRASAASFHCSRITDHSNGTIEGPFEMDAPNWGGEWAPKQIVWKGFPHNQLAITGLEGQVPATRLVVATAELSARTWKGFLETLHHSAEKRKAVLATLRAGERIRGQRRSQLPALPNELMAIIAREAVEMPLRPFTDKAVQ